MQAYIQCSHRHTHTHTHTHIYTHGQTESKTRTLHEHCTFFLFSNYEQSLSANEEEKKINHEKTTQHQHEMTCHVKPFSNESHQQSSDQNFGASNPTGTELHNQLALSVYITRSDIF